MLQTFTNLQINQKKTEIKIRKNFDKVQTIIKKNNDNKNTNTKLFFINFICEQIQLDSVK